MGAQEQELQRGGFARLARHTFTVSYAPGEDAAPRLRFDAEHAARDCGVERLEDGGFVAVDGYLFPDDELSDVPRDRMTRTILAGYARYGADVVDRLRGPFAFALWDPRRRLLLLGRDASGLSTCFYAHERGRLVASPSLDGVLAERDVPADYDRVVLAELLMFSYPPHQREQTPYARVRRLLPAHLLELTHAGLHVRRYHHPFPEGTPWASAAEVAAFPDVLERAVRRCLDAGAESIALSGGFDSVSLALAAARVRGGRAPLRAISLRAMHPSCDESAAQIAVARALGMPHVLFAVEEVLGGKTLAEAAFERFEALPSPVISMWNGPYNGLLQRSGEPGQRRIMLGTGGDELYNVDQTYGEDALRTGQLRSLYRYLRAGQRTAPVEGTALGVARAVLWNGALRPMLRERVARTAPWLVAAWRSRPHPYVARTDGALRAALRARRLSQVPPQRAPTGSAYLLMLREMMSSAGQMRELDQTFAWGRSQGATVMLPFFDRELVELSLRLHPADLLQLGRHKSPLRGYVADLERQAPLPKRKVQFTYYGQALLRQELLQTWDGLGGTPRLAELGLVDEQRLRRIVQQFCKGRRFPALALWVAVATERWLCARASVLGSPAPWQGAPTDTPARTQVGPTHVNPGSLPSCAKSGA